MANQKELTFQWDGRNVSQIQTATQGLSLALADLRSVALQTFSDRSALQFSKATTGALVKLQNTLSSVKRSLAGFDQLQRMDKVVQTVSAGKSTSKSTQEQKKDPTQVFMEYLETVDTFAVMTRLNIIKMSVQECYNAIHKSRQDIDLWCGSLMKLAQILLYDAQIVSQFSNTLYQANLIIGAVSNAAINLSNTAIVLSRGLLSNIQITTALVTQMNNVRGVLNQTALAASGVGTAWMGLRSQGLALCATLGSMAQNLAVHYRTLFGSVLTQSVATGLQQSNAAAQSGLLSMVAFVTGKFTPLWRNAWNCVGNVFSAVMDNIPGKMRETANSTISVLNQLLSGIAVGCNRLVTGLNSIRVQVAQTSGVSVSRISGISVPKIPYLAQGAVLPANKPFMAVVGDQRHGTNVEAPLATIQEAVAAVMEDFIAGNQAGHTATVGVLREILEAVLGIGISDDMIGAAVTRYQNKLSVMKGGVF